MSFTLEANCKRAVVKNTFIHIEGVSENRNDNRLSYRRKSDASDIRYSARSELVFEVDLSIVADTGVNSVALSTEPNTKLNLGVSCIAVKNTFVHIDKVEEDFLGTCPFQRRSRRCRTDLLHARDAHAISYKLEKETPVSSENENPTPPTHDDDGSPSQSVRSMRSMSICSGSSGCSTRVGEDALVPQESVGSAGHYEGLCRPCVWFWRPSSCSKGSSCDYCHMCDEGAVARAVASKKAMKKNKKLKEVTTQ